jgi:flagellar assembly protein FliH
VETQQQKLETRLETLQLGRRVRNVRCASTTVNEVSTTRRAPDRQSEDLALLQAERQEKERLAREHAELVQLQNGVLDAMSRALPNMTQQGERGLIALALEAVDKLMAGIPLTPELVEATVREALRQVREGAEVTVLLHEEDLALLQGASSSWMSGAQSEGRLQFRAASEVTRGGCIVQSPFGVIDARRETKSALLKKALLE